MKALEADQQANFAQLKSIKLYALIASKTAKSLSSQLKASLSIARNAIKRKEDFNSVNAQLGNMFFLYCVIFNSIKGRFYKYE